MQEELTQALYEKLIIQYLMNDEVVRDKLLPYLNPNIFKSHSNSHIIKDVLKFIEVHEHFPKMNELKLFIKENETYDKLIEIMNIDNSEYDREFILGELEEFYRKSLLSNVMIEMVENLKNEDSQKMSDYSDKIRECASFTFDNSIGTSLLDDIDRIYSSLHDSDRVNSTGIPLLNYYTGGGFHEKSLVLFLGQVNLGKSLVLYSLAVNFLLNNKKVLILSLEMSEEKVFERILANLFDVEIGLLKNLTKQQFFEYYELVKKKLKNNLYVIQKSPKSVNSNILRNILKEYKVKRNVEFDIVVIDYLGLMSTNRLTKTENLYSDMKTVSEEVRAVAVEEKICIISAIQSNRDGFGKLDLDMTNVSESIGVAATCDLLIGIMQNEELRAAGKYKWSILKNRYGLNEINMYIGVDYQKMRIYSIDDNIPEVISPKNIVDEAAVEVLKTMQNNMNDKRQKLMEIE